MDPSGLLNPQWNHIGELLTSLWIVAGLVFFFAANMLMGHVVIPSLVITLHLHPVFNRARPLFYVVAVVSLLIAIFLAVAVVKCLLEVLPTFWNDFWI